MEDLYKIIADHRSRKPILNSNMDDPHKLRPSSHATYSEIPDVFFDEVLVRFKLTRVELLVLMNLYRLTWCRPNIYKEFGISPMIGHSHLSVQLEVDVDIVLNSLRKLEEWGFISTIRSGQYFVRKFFTRENDEKYGQTYHDFEL